MITVRYYFLPESSTSKLSSLMNKDQRAQSEATSDLFNCLYCDLKALYEWQKETSDIQAVHDLKNSNLNIESIPFTGELWLRRGMLSERLIRTRLAERAYRYVVDKGFSLFAWYRLMKIYVKGGNPKAVIVCVTEVISQLEQEKILFNELPSWMDEVLAEMCKGCGYRQLISICEELKTKKFPALIKSLDRLKYWKTDGVVEDS
jgi:hypothetical protein